MRRLVPLRGQLLAHPQAHRPGPLRPHHLRPPLGAGRGARPARPRHPRRRLRVLRQARRGLLLLPRPRPSPPRARPSRRATRTSRPSSTPPSRSRTRPAIKLLWGTANLFSNPRFQAGAATKPDPEVFAYAAAQVRHALDATKSKLGGQGYTFWGGREGYDTLLNTDIEAQELRSPRPVPAHGRRLREDHRLRGPVLHRAQAQGADQAPVRLRRRRLPQLPPRVRPDGRTFKLNLETNHATLAGHSMGHEMRTAREAKAPWARRRQHRRRAPRLGHRPVPHRRLPHLRDHAGADRDGRLHHRRPELRRQGPPTEPRRDWTSSTPTSAAWTPSPAAWRSPGRSRRTGGLAGFVEERYKGWSSGFGADLLAGRVTLEEADEHALAAGEPKRKSGRQEMLENLVNEFVL